MVVKSKELRSNYGLIDSEYVGKREITLWLAPLFFVWEMVIELCMPKPSKILMLERNKNTFIVVNKDNVSSNDAFAEENSAF